MLLPRVLGDASDVCDDGNDKTSSSRTRTIYWKEYGCPTQTKATIESICWIAHHIPHIPHLFLETRRLRLLVFGSQDE